MKKIKLLPALFVLAINAVSQNYDESKVPVYTLPPLFPVTIKQDERNSQNWERTRRLEVVALFRNSVYGQMPKTYDDLKFVLTNEVPDAMGGKASLKELDITVLKSGNSVTIHLILFIPNNRKKPAPAFLLINNRGKNNTDPKRIEKSEFWPAEMLINSGYAIAAFHVNDAAPDDSTTYQNGVLKLYPEQLKAPNGMKAIGAWAWAASRVMDYFEEQNNVDAKRVCIVGHSRGGKAALWAGAEDKRFAIVISNCSGNSGAALSRRKFGETVKRINDRFPYWFCDNYKNYNDNEASLPVDQHLLISLMAPRPVYVTSASKDLWADPKGSYLSLIHGQEVYALYGKTSGLTPEPPAINVPIIHSYLGYHNREGIHDLTAYDWKNFILFANYHFHKP